MQQGLANQPAVTHIWLIAGNDPIGRRRQRDAAVLPLVYETECSLTSSSQKTPQDYWNRAEACERLADAGKSEETREIMRYVASRPAPSNCR